MEQGKFKNEICDVLIPQRKGDPITFNVDESPRKDITIDIGEAETGFRKRVPSRPAMLRA